MKYLKTYKLFEASLWNLFGIDRECQQDLKDICLELQDVGYEIEIFASNGGRSKTNFECIDPQPKLHLRITKPGVVDDRFSYNKEVSEVVKRIKDFMKMKGFSTEVEKCRHYKVLRFIQRFKMPERKLYQVLLTFTKYSL